MDITSLREQFEGLARDNALVFTALARLIKITKINDDELHDCLIERAAKATDVESATHQNLSRDNSLICRSLATLVDFFDDQETGVIGQLEERAALGISENNTNKHIFDENGIGFSAVQAVASFKKFTGYDFHPTVPGQLLARRNIKKLDHSGLKSLRLYDKKYWKLAWEAMVALAEDRARYPGQPPRPHACICPEMPTDGWETKARATAKRAAYPPFPEKNYGTDEELAH